MSRFALLLLALSSFVHADVLVFSTDFSSVQGSGTLLGSGTLTNYAGNTILWNTAPGRPSAATRLVLNSLPTHGVLSLEFTFWAIDSWDGLSNTCCGTDYFEILLDGSLVYRAAVRNWGITPATTESESVPGAAQLVFSSPVNLIGNAQYTDSLWNIRLSLLPHLANSATFEFRANGTGWDGLTDESFALDNLAVYAAEVPEPASLAWLTLLFAAWAASRRLT